VIRVVLTTSHRSSQKLRHLLNDIYRAIPGTYKLNRGRRPMLQVLEDAVSLGAKYIALFHSRRGNPSRIFFIDVPRRLWLPYALDVPGYRSRVDYASMQVFGPVFRSARRARNCVVADLTGGDAAVDAFVEVFGCPAVPSPDLERLRHFYDTIIVMRESFGLVKAEFLGRDLGPRGVMLKLRYVEVRGGEVGVVDVEGVD